MNVLITGGTGYLGGRIADHLKTARGDVKLYLTALGSQPLGAWARNFNILRMDVLEDKSIARCFEACDFDAVVHLAAINEIDSMKDPELAIDVNTKGTFDLLRAASERGVKSFIYFSTFHVYGETAPGAINEDSPTRPHHPYAITHRTAEDYVRHFARYHDMQTLVLRLSNGYGYPMDTCVNRWTLVFNDLCRQAVTTGKIVLTSSGRQHRDFIALSDVARGVAHFLGTEDKWGDGLYNLGGNCSMSILEVAERVADVYAEAFSKPRPVIQTAQDNGAGGVFEPVRYDISKLLETGFTLTGDMDAEIRETLKLCLRLV
ncbi:MAG: SDR family oxidoreductase [Phycisphaerae bacterium]|nr:SDR family oxidoreductase [Phycisphaerae bacterium]